MTSRCFTLESAFGSVEPHQHPEDFDELTREAKAIKAAETVAGLVSALDSDSNTSESHDDSTSKAE